MLPELRWVLSVYGPGIENWTPLGNTVIPSVSGEVDSLVRKPTLHRRVAVLCLWFSLCSHPHRDWDQEGIGDWIPATARPRGRASTWTRGVKRRSPCGKMWSSHLGCRVWKGSRRSSCPILYFSEEKTQAQKFSDLSGVARWVGWYHWLNEDEFEQTLGDSEGQWSLVCCSFWGGRKSDMTGRQQQGGMSWWWPDKLIYQQLLPLPETVFENFLEDQVCGRGLVRTKPDKRSKGLWEGLVEEVPENCPQTPQLWNCLLHFICRIPPPVGPVVPWWRLHLGHKRDVVTQVLQNMGDLESWKEGSRERQLMVFRGRLDL